MLRFYKLTKYVISINKVGLWTHTVFTNSSGDTLLPTSRPDSDIAADSSISFAGCYIQTEACSESCNNLE